MPFTYKVIPDVFADLPDDEYADQFLPRFGLIESDPVHGWQNLKTRMKHLNEMGAESSTTYRVLFIGRHGEGYHNRAMDLYGYEKWAEVWAKGTTDGNITWGPDPLLTEVGIQQARQVNRLWKEELAYDIPIPESFYCSPLSRAITTALISFEGIALGMASDEDGEKTKPKAIIKEKLRERKYLFHTCNKRRPRSFIKETYPQFEIEEEFTEEDEMWSNISSESDDQLRSRVRDALDDIFENDKSTFISITAHAITNKAIREVLGAPPIKMPTGGVFVFLVQVAPNSST